MEWNGKVLKKELQRENTMSFAGVLDLKSLVQEHGR